tara:strand:+ start:529 stop:951 length:423 start_codon:yes stop_codon:yes gene_type:complete
MIAVPPFSSYDFSHFSKVSIQSIPSNIILILEGFIKAQKHHAIKLMDTNLHTVLIVLIASLTLLLESHLLHFHHHESQKRHVYAHGSFFLFETSFFGRMRNLYKKQREIKKYYFFSHFLKKLRTAKPSTTTDTFLKLITK